ncbi:MAG: hypothetical protein IKU25_03675 [Clostridia bacterium]|nr:hypothetical protein [Clostridia bacterium]
MSFQSSNDILNAAVELLSGTLSNHATVIRHFPDRIKPLPLKNVTITVGSIGRNISSKYLGDRLSDTLHGKEVALQIEVAVYVPLTKNSALAFTALDDAVNTLINDGRFEIKEVKYGKISANRDTGSFELHANLTSIFYETEG